MKTLFKIVGIALVIVFFSELVCFALWGVGLAAVIGGWRYALKTPFAFRGGRLTKQLLKLALLWWSLAFLVNTLTHLALTPLKVEFTKKVFTESCTADYQPVIQKRDAFLGKYHLKVVRPDGLHFGEWQCRTADSGLSFTDVSSGFYYWAP